MFKEKGMLKGLLKKMYRNQKGITGLETAIILIAFVVVASVFAYTVLSAGIFSSQKGKEAIYSGLSEARATLEPKGGMLAYKGTVNATDTAGKVSFIVTNAMDGQAIDLTPSYVITNNALVANTAAHVALISYVDKNWLIDDAAWTVSFIGKNNGDTLLESGEQAVITVWILNCTDTTVPTYAIGAGFINDNTKMLAPYDTFTVEVKAAKGAAVTMQRTLPPRIDTVMDLN
jgi:archaeal flagellin FlaB